MADVENTQVNEEPVEEQVDITGTEIISNGEHINTDSEKSVTEEETDTDEEDKEETAEDEPAVEQKDLEQAQSELKDAKDELTSKGIDYDALEAEYNENGKLSDESYKMLEEKGYPKALVTAAIAGWQAKADAFANKVIENAGGKREYNRIQNFVYKQGKEAVSAFNEIIEKSDLNVVSSYIAGIKAQMVAKFGTDNPTLAGNNAGGNAKGFADASEMVKAMSDPRYGKDAKYMKEVEAKVAKSTFF